MGNGRRIQNKVNNIPKSKNYIDVLSGLLGDFYEFLSKEGQPTDQEVRDRFISDRQTWFLYCGKHNLNYSIKDLFVLNIATMWKHNQNHSN